MPKKKFEQHIRGHISSTSNDPDDELILHRIKALKRSKSENDKKLRNKPKKINYPIQTIGITEVRKIGWNSLLVKWTPATVQSTIGYSLYINRKLKMRVFNRTRNMSVLDYLPINTLFVITVREIGADGREKSNGASTVYKIVY